jgi:hypothetical protein
MHVRFIPGQWPLGLHLTAEHPPWLKLLGKPDERFDRCIFTTMHEAVRNVGCRRQKKKVSITLSLYDP